MTIKSDHRPLSPHLQIYRWPMNMAMSILHRITGIGNMIGLVLFTWWLVAAASGPESYQTFIGFITAPLGYLMLFGWSVSVSYHMCNGVRHLLWDTGHALTIKNATTAGMIVLAATLLFVAFIWLG